MDQFRLVERVRRDLHPPHRHHVRKDISSIGVVMTMRGVGEQLFSERDAGLHGDDVGGERSLYNGVRKIVLQRKKRE